MRRLLAALRARVGSRRLLLIGGVVTAVTVGVLAIVLEGLALSPSKFEIDGVGSDGFLKANLVTDTTGNIDWCADQPSAGTPQPVKPNLCGLTAPNFLSKTDLVNSQSDDSLGQGSDEDQDPPIFTTGSIPPQKSDLSRFYIASEAIGNPATPFLYLGWERSNTLGSANMDFEFNKSAPVNGRPPARTAGDMLVTFDFAQGGKTVGIGLLRWVTSATGTVADCFKNSKLPCWGKEKDLTGGATVEAEGSVFDSATDTDTVYDPIAGVDVGVRRFGEAAINLKQALDLGPNDCATFGSAYLKSRASDSFQSELKDFDGPIANPISFCQPATIKLQKKDDRDGSFLAGAVMQLFQETNGTAGLQIGTGGDTQVGSDCTTSASDGIGNCIFSITQSGTYYGHEKTPPPGFTATGSDVTQVVNIGGTTQTFTLTFQDHPQPGKIVVLKKDDANPQNLVGGAVFRLWKDVNGNGTLETGTDTQVGSDCTTPSSGTDLGKCTFSGLDPGKYLVQEISVPAEYGSPSPDVIAVEVTVVAGGDTKTITFTNPRKHRVIVIVCHQGTNTLIGANVTFAPGTANERTRTTLSSSTSPTAATLCNLGGATFSVPAHGLRNFNVDIPAGPGGTSDH
jgi:hypothetical protein